MSCRSRKRMATFDWFDFWINGHEDGGPEKKSSIFPGAR